MRLLRARLAQEQQQQQQLSQYQLGENDNFVGREQVRTLSQQQRRAPNSIN